MNAPLISVIIPCYNHGMFIDEALKSLELELNPVNFEVIIVNDGSNDPFTIQKLNSISFPNTLVLHQNNRGLAAARNAGIVRARGKYILPLDADNRIVMKVMLEACELMESYGEIDMVYTDAYFFGEKKGLWKVGELNPMSLLDNNMIDACCLLRKSTLTELGMYDEHMPGMGNEDWELLVNLFVHHKNIFYLQKTGFCYRVRSASMSMTVTGQWFDKNKRHIYYKHFLSTDIEKVSFVIKDKSTLYKFVEPLAAMNESLFSKKLLVYRKKVGFWKISRAFIAKYRLNARYFDRKTRINNLSFFYPVCKHLRTMTMIAEATCLIKPVPRQWSKILLNKHMP